MLDALCRSGHMTFAKAASNLPVAEPPVPVPVPVVPVAPKTRPEAGRRPNQFRRKDVAQPEAAEPAEEKSEVGPPTLSSASSSAAPPPDPPPAPAAPAVVQALVESSVESAAPRISEAAKRCAALEKELHAAVAVKERLAICIKLLRLLPKDELEALESSNDARERKPVRLALEYTGEEDVSWVNAQSMLRSGKAFIKTVLSMDGEAYITWKQLKRMDEFGPLDVAALAERSIVARILAIYLEICMSQARERLISESPAPRILEEPPDWPIRVPVAEVQLAVLEAARWGRTALLVCDGSAFEVDSFFKARGCVTIGGGWVEREVETMKVLRVDDILQALHSRMIAALHSGSPIHIAMGTTVTAFSDTYCEDRTFPKAVFNNKIFTMLQEQPTRYMLPGDPPELADAFVSRARPECYSFVTTDFSMSVVRDRLSKVLPYFADMAICEVVP